MPAADNRWGIQIGGTNDEDFTIPPYVTIIGKDNTTTLTGQVDSNSAFGADLTSMARIQGCVIEDIHMATEGNVLIVLHCTLLGCSSTANGTLFIGQSTIYGGDFTTHGSDIVITNSEIYGTATAIAFDEPEMYHCTIRDLSGSGSMITFTSMSRAENCYFAEVNFNAGSPYKFRNCHLDHCTLSET